MLQLREWQLYFTGRRGHLRMPAAHFLFAALQVVSDCRTSRRQAPVCRTQSDRGQKEMYRVRHVLCIYFKQRQILPGLPQADTAHTSVRAQEKTASIVTR